MSILHSRYGGLKAKFATVATVVALSGVTAFVPVVAQGASLTPAQIDAIVKLLQSFGADATTIANVQSALTGAPAPAPSPSGKCSFTRDLTTGVTGDDVKCLQQYLNSAGHTVASSGAGSPGNETTYFGSLTKAAVAKWQAANGVSPAAGYFGSISRAKYNSLMAGVQPSPPPPGPTPSGSDLRVTAAADQPASSLAPERAARVPFTKIVLWGPSDGDVTVNSITVERQGLMDDTAIASVVVLDENGVQMGLEKTLNASHRAILTEKVTVPKGGSRTLLIAANMDTDLDQETGQVGRLAVVAIDAGSASVSGLPIVGNSMTVNSTLAIGQLASPTRGPLDPGAARTSLEVGTTNFIASSGKWTAGSEEPIMLEQVRWYQAGSAGTADLKNVRVVVNGVEYGASPSSDGRYYVARLGSSVEVDKGASLEVAVRLDVEGGSDRTIDFDIQRRTDIVVKGKTFGYYLTPANGLSANTSTQGEGFTSTEPYYDGYSHTIAKGSLRVEKSNKVAASNVPVDVSNTELGAFMLEAKGEPVQITSFTLGFAVSAGEDGTQIDSVSIYDKNGSVVAGPKDVGAGVTNASVTFTDTWTVPVGSNDYVIKGKLTTDFEDGDTVQASTTPSLYITAKGEVTGLSISATPSSVVTANPQTVKRAALRVAIAPSPAAQNVVRGVTGFLFAKVQYDATDSGEDLRITAQKLGLTPANGAQANDLNTCQLFDGTTALNTGGNVVTPDETSPNTQDSLTFNMDTELIIPKGTVKVVDVKCNISNSPSAGETFQIGLTSANSDTTVVGKNTGVTVTETVTLNDGPIMTIKTGGTLTISLDASSPTSERYGIANKADVLLTVLKIRATDEAIRLDRIALTLSSSTASTSDLKKVTLWDGATKVGEAVFQGTHTRATSTLTTAFEIPKDSEKLLTIKGDLAQLGVNEAATRGHLIAVNYDGEAVTTTKGTGLSSGLEINPSAGSDTAGAGVRLVRTYPTLERLSVPSNTLANGEMVLFRFKVTADAAGDVGLAKMVFRVSSTTAATTSVFKLYAYSDSGFATNAYAQNPVHSRNIDKVEETVWDKKVVGDSSIYFYFNPVGYSNPSATASTSEALNIPAGGSRYFELRGTIANSAAGDSISVALRGDAAVQNTNLVGRQQADAVDQAGKNFIWSPNTTTTAATTTNDWLNGYQVPGLPNTEMTQQTFTK